MPRIELVFDRDCPHVPRARDRLRQAITRPGLEASWTELRDDTDRPPHALGYGSPTILVHGRDVTGAPAESGACCRVHHDDAGATDGAPSVETIARALQAALASPA